MNTSPNPQTVNVSFTDVFVDQGASYQSATFTLYDLWQKDPSLGAWGLNLGEFSGGVPNVQIGTHQTKVWKAVPASNSKRRDKAEL